MFAAVFACFFAMSVLTLWQATAAPQENWKKKITAHQNLGRHISPQR